MSDQPPNTSSDRNENTPNQVGVKKGKNPRKQKGIGLKTTSNKKGLKYIGYGMGGIFALFILAWMFTGPSSGSMRYGICKIFLEQSIPFPKTLNISAVWESRALARIQYSHIDAFGQYRLSKIQCNFGEDQDYANRNFIKNILEQISNQGGDVSDIAKAANLPEKVIKDYMSGDRARLPSNTAIMRISSRFSVPAPSAAFILKSVTVDGRSFPDEAVKDFRETIPVIVANPPDLTYPAPLPASIKDYKS